jgi:hypothetical protein
MFRFDCVNEHCWGWINNKLLIAQTTQTTGVVAYKDDVPVAACVLDNWTESSCNIHIIIENPIVLRHGFLEEVFEFVFGFRKKLMVWGFTPSDNHKALKFNKHVGMVEQFRMKDASSQGVDLVVTRMHRDDCRWLQNAQAA